MSDCSIILYKVHKINVTSKHQLLKAAAAAPNAHSKFHQSMHAHRGKGSIRVPGFYLCRATLCWTYRKQIVN